MIFEPAKSIGFLYNNRSEEIRQRSFGMEPIVSQAIGSTGKTHQKLPLYPYHPSLLA